MNVILDDLKTTDAEIILGARVKEINYEEGTVKAEKDGVESIYQGDYVVSTVSIGVMRNKPEIFNPELPDDKKLAISRVDMATFTKIFCSFKQ